LKNNVVSQDYLGTIWICQIVIYLDFCILDKSWIFPFSCQIYFCCLLGFPNKFSALEFLWFKLSFYFIL